MFGFRDYGATLLPISHLSTGVSHNNLFIAHNIWPRSPYENPAFYTWCQGLPAYLRANKNIVRAFYEAHGFPAEIYNPAQNEDFGDFFKRAFVSGIYDDLIQDVAADSAVARLGYIDVPALLHTYVAYRDGSEAHPLGRFNLYLWLSIELSIRGMRHATIRW